MAYNGWRNRETWLVNVWFGDMFADDTDTEWSPEAIKDFIYDYVYEREGTNSGFISDMLNLECIDYVALARHGDHLME